MSKNIEQTVIIKASAHDVYEALMDSKKHAEFTDAEAKISREVGGKIQAWGDYIEGENLELVPDKKIVQKWRASDWPNGHYSTVTFALAEKDGQTELKFTQENVPPDEKEAIAEGWEDYYWKPLKEYFKK